MSMSKFVDSVFSFLGRRSSKDRAGEPAAVPKRSGGGRKAVLKADSFVFLPGECTSNGTYLWGEVITPRTVGVPLSSYSDDYSVLSGDNRRKNARSVLIDGSGKLVGRRLSGSFVAKAVKTHKSLDEVEDGSLEAFMKEFEEERDERYHTYDRANLGEAGADESKYTYDRLVHWPSPAEPVAKRQQREEESRRRDSQQLVLDLRERGRRRASSSGSGERFHAVSVEPKGRREEAVDWEGLLEMLEETAVRGGQRRGRSVKGAATHTLLL